MCDSKGLISLAAAEEGLHGFEENSICYLLIQRHISPNRHGVVGIHEQPDINVTHLIPLPAEFFNTTPRVLFLCLFKYACALITVFVSVSVMVFITMFDL